MVTKPIAKRAATGGVGRVGAFEVQVWQQDLVVFQVGRMLIACTPVGSDGREGLDVQ